MRHIVEQVDTNLLDEFQRLGASIGARIIFPSKPATGISLNVARGFSRSIADRIDLTLECIRRQFEGEANPLDKTLGRDWAFFEAFRDFEGYVDFFALQDLTHTGKVNFFLPFDGDFATSGFPQCVEDYLEYAERSMDFVQKRNSRLSDLIAHRG